METKLYDNALLSEAAYADFSNISNSDDVKAALTTSGFSPTQAEAFVTQWRVVDHQPNTLSSPSLLFYRSKFYEDCH